MTKKPALKRKRGAAIKSRAKSPNMMSGGIAIKIKKIPAKKAMILRSQLLSMLPKTRSHKMIWRASLNMTAVFLMLSLNWIGLWTVGETVAYYWDTEISSGNFFGAALLDFILEPEDGWRTQTQGGWGSSASGDNPGAYRDANFAAAFPAGATIGDAGGFTATFSTSGAVETFLPASGTAAAFSQNYSDPASTSAGVLAGQTLALTLSVGFDAYDPDFGLNLAPLGEVAVLGGACDGMTVSEVLEEANKVLAGLPSSFSASDINSCIDAINNQYDDGNWGEAELGEGETYERNIKTVDLNSINFKYTAEAEKTGGSDDFCNALNLNVLVEGNPVYSGGLLAFVSPILQFSTSTDDFTYQVTLPTSAPDFTSGEFCEYDFVYKGWQNEFPIFPNGYHDIESVSNRVTPAPPPPNPDQCPFDEGAGKTIIYFNNKTLLANGNQAAATDGPIVGFVPAGTYDITLASFDGHLSHPGQIQNNEQWKLIMKNAAGSQVAVTAPIIDIPNEPIEQVTEKVGDDFVVSENIYQFTAFHNAYPNSNPNSVRALCAMFEGENLNGQAPGSPPAGRVTDGLLALYDFEETSGPVVWDVSGVGAPLNLWVPDLSKISGVWGGISVNSSTLISSFVPALKLINGSKSTNEITIEAWVKPANTAQGGPARIATLSTSTVLRNFTLGQETTQYTGRLRTTTAGNNGVLPSIFTPAGTATTDLEHVVYTRDSAGTAKIYKNGIETATLAVGGNLSNWDSAMRFGLANEFTMNRTWLGEFHLLAIYNRDLAPAEILQNFAAEADRNIVINEFLPNPIGADDAAKPDGEWVELYNLSGSPKDVAGWYLYDSLDSHPLQITSSNSDNNGNTSDAGETVIPASGFLVVYLDGAYSSGWLNNAGGDSVRLYNATIGSGGILKDSYAYSGSASENKSYARIPDGTGDFVDPIPTPLKPNKSEAPAETSTWVSDTQVENEAPAPVEELMSNDNATTSVLQEMATTTEEESVNDVPEAGTSTDPLSQLPEDDLENAVTTEAPLPEEQDIVEKIIEEQSPDVPPDAPNVAEPEAAENQTEPIIENEETAETLLTEEPVAEPEPTPEEPASEPEPETAPIEQPVEEPAI